MQQRIISQKVIIIQTNHHTQISARDCKINKKDVLL